MTVFKRTYCVFFYFSIILSYLWVHALSYFRPVQWSAAQWGSSIIQGPGCQVLLQDYNWHAESELSYQAATGATQGACCEWSVCATQQYTDVVDNCQPLGGIYCPDLHGLSCSSDTFVPPFHWSCMSLHLILLIRHVTYLLSVYNTLLSHSRNITGMRTWNTLKNGTCHFMEFKFQD